VKIGVAQINTTVGDFPGNRDLIINAYHQLTGDGAELVIFPEMAICGYPPRDLLFKKQFVPRNLEILGEIAATTRDVPMIVGFVEPNPRDEGKPFYNAAAWCHQGKVGPVFRKCLLPSYDVFDEDRYFQAWGAPGTISYKGKTLAITLCEDLWTAPEVNTNRHYAVEPVAMLRTKKTDILLNLSASPWHFDKQHLRQRILRYAVANLHCPLVYCNLIGGNDELIFDGRSTVLDKDANLLAGLPAYQEALQIVDLDQATGRCEDSFDLNQLEDIRRALVRGLRDYVGKTGFTKALIGLSGGIDSALTAVLAVEALGKDNVIGVSLPSPISSQHSQDDAQALAQNLGITYHHLPIGDLVAAAEKQLAPLFEGLETDITEENIQARSRGLLLMALSNKWRCILLTTGNKSEMAVGYCTLYGDMAGGLGLLSDLPKTKVFALARHINRDQIVIPENTITKPPSAELRPDQKDEDSLPPYDILDAIIEAYVEQGLGTSEIVERGYEEAIVRDIIRKIDLNEYKRKQAAPGLKITPLAFGVGRRIPIVQKFVT